MTNSMKWFNTAFNSSWEQTTTASARNLGPIFPWGRLLGLPLNSKINKNKQLHQVGSLLFTSHPESHYSVLLKRSVVTASCRSRHISSPISCTTASRRPIPIQAFLKGNSIISCKPMFKRAQASTQLERRQQDKCCCLSSGVDQPTQSMLEWEIKPQQHLVTWPCQQQQQAYHACAGHLCRKQALFIRYRCTASNAITSPAHAVPSRHHCYRETFQMLSIFFSDHHPAKLHVWLTGMWVMPASDLLHLSCFPMLDKIKLAESTLKWQALKATANNCSVLLGRWSTSKSQHNTCHVLDMLQRPKLQFLQAVWPLVSNTAAHGRKANGQQTASILVALESASD